MRVIVSRDVEWFSRQAEAFLADAVERNVLATTLVGIRDGLYDDVLLALGFDGDAAGPDRVVAAAIRTPPRHMLATGFTDPEAAAELVGRWVELDPGLTGVSATVACANAVAAAWAALTEAASELQFAEAIHVLTHVINPPEPPAGGLRQAETADQAMLVDWLIAFAMETGFGDVAGVPRVVERLLDSAAAFIWKLDSRPVALVGHSRMVAGVVRIGPVYTPPQERGHGYATIATAAVSRRQLAAGAHSCMLYTDLANPISNHIYAKIGYVRVGDWEERKFIAAGQRDTDL
jgi:predicted GNAT family acetyltransferase